jgi:hypothetical protein
LIKTFGQYVRLREDMNDNSGVSAPIGNGAGQIAPYSSRLQMAFKDLSASISSALNGPTGSQILNAIVNAVMSDPQVPNGVKQEIRQKVSTRWTHLIDLSNSPPGQGPGLGNVPGNVPTGRPPDLSMNNMIVPNAGDTGGTI